LLIIATVETILVNSLWCLVTKSELRLSMCWDRSVFGRVGDDEAHQQAGNFLNQQTATKPLSSALVLPLRLRSASTRRQIQV